MSKSRGNVVIPDAYIQKWGADTLRMYLMFLGPFQEGGDFRDTTIHRGAAIPRQALDGGPRGGRCSSPSTLSAEVERKLHQTIKRVTTDTERLDSTRPSRR